MRLFLVTMLALCAAAIPTYPLTAGANDHEALSREPAAGAPKAVKDMQAFIGDWACKPSRLQQDGTWSKPPHTHIWKWYYALGGRAVQDFWFPDQDAQGKPGTNLRMYDPEAESWFIAWSTTAMKQFDLLSATFDGEKMILKGHKNASEQVSEHDRRITFHNISSDHFDWKYEAKGMSEDAAWSEVFRLACDRE